MTTRTLTWKTTLRFAALVTVTTALVLAAGGWLVGRQMRRGLSLLHEGEARELLGFLAGAERTPEAVRERVLRDSEGDAEWFFIQIHDDSGAVLFRSSNLGAAILPDLSPDGDRKDVRLPGVGEVLVSEVREDGWHIQVGSPLTAEHLMVADYAQVSFLLVGGAGLAALGLGYAFSRVTLRPLRVIAETARRMSGENLRERVPPREVRDELSEFGEILNQTFDRLEAAFGQVSRFAGDASHELKTPLALMRLNAERLRARLAPGGPEEAVLDELLEALDRMQTVIERLLFLARADGGAWNLQAVPVSVPELVAGFAEDATALLEDVGARFEVTHCDEGQLKGEPALLRQLLLNLVGNASRVSPPGGRVTLEAWRTVQGWRLVVEDEGPGLPEAELERVFGRFVRYAPTSGEERRNGTRGDGLGLAICRSIAKLHGGTIRAENRSGAQGGLRVVLNLPAPT